MVSILLRAPVPMALLWGEEGILLYNARYATIAQDKHPAILGMPVREAWTEAAAFNDGVVRAGMAGKTGMLVGLVNDAYVHLPFRAVAAQRKMIDPKGNIWMLVLESTGQPLSMKN